MLVAIRCRTSLDGCEPERRGNRESVLLEPAQWEERFPHDRDAVARTAELAERLEFDLTAGPRLPLPRLLRHAASRRSGSSPASATTPSRSATATRTATSGARASGSTRSSQLIDELGLAGFFLLHWEVLELARECALEVRGGSVARNVLPPGRGRGSSVGSIVCYLTGLSHVDPVRPGLSLGRFINSELASVPDIDLDFPRDIREKLIVAVCERYGREHSALVASFSTYRARGAIRDVGKALGLPFGELERLARLTDGNPYRVGEELAKLPDADAKRASPRWRAFARLCGEIGGLPRHISQHPGGMVISTRPLVELVPVQPAAMEGRQLCQWDKDSCADAGFLKIDLLGLGMLSAVEDCVEQIARRARQDRRPLAHPARRRGGLRRDPGRGHRRRLPDREPRADAVAAADAAREPRRPDHPGSARTAGADPGRRGPSVHRESPAAARGPRRSWRRATTRCWRSRCARRWA